MSAAISFPQRIGKHIMRLLLAGGILAVLVNALHPGRIPWIQDWDNYVESKARAAGIAAVPLRTAYSFHQSGGHLFVDARIPSDFTKGHIAGAVLLPFERLDEHLEAVLQLIRTGVPLVVYCSNRECDDALLLAIELRNMGQSNLSYYVDGYETWEESGCPVTSE